MKRRNLILIIFLTLSLMFTSLAVSYAADPSGLVVVRASDNSLWKATCVGTTCTAFTNFPGLFGSQPTVYWDENIQRYVLWGRAADNTIWRSTFDRLGVFYNDWVQITGLTASPPGAAGGGISQNTWFVNPSGVDIELTSTIANLKSDYVVCPWDGAVLATSSGTIEHYRTSATGAIYARIYLAEASGGTATTWTFTDLPSGTPTGYTSFPYSITRSFSCPAGGGDKYVYVTGEEGGSGATTTTTWVQWPGLFLQYIPYSY